MEGTHRSVASTTGLRRTLKRNHLERFDRHQNTIFSFTLFDPPFLWQPLNRQIYNTAPPFRPAKLCSFPHHQRVLPSSVKTISLDVKSPPSYLNQFPVRAFVNLCRLPSDCISLPSFVAYIVNIFSLTASTFSNVLPSNSLENLKGVATIDKLIP